MSITIFLEKYMPITGNQDNEKPRLGAESGGTQGTNGRYWKWYGK